MDLREFADQKKYRKIFSGCRLKIRDIVDQHRKLRPDFEWNGKLDLAFDGVVRSAQSKDSLQVLVIRLSGCSTYWPLMIYEDCKSHRKNPNTMLQPYVTEILEEGFDLNLVITDTVMRNKLLGLGSHAGRYSCPMCLIEGKSVKYRRQGKDQSKFAFVYDPRNPPRPRTDDIMEACMKRCDREGGKCQTPDDNYGVRERSVLSQLPKSLSKLLALDPMHLLYEGVYKRTFLCTYPVAAVKTNFSLTERFDVGRAQDVYLRQTRLTETKPLKPFAPTDSASEWRNKQVIWFPVFLESLSQNQDVCEVFKWLAMIGRWYLFDTVDHEEVPLCVDMDEILIHFQEVYVHAFGEVNAVYNLHLVSHLSQLYLQHGPLYNTSAFGAESVYGYICRHSSAKSRNITFTWMKNGVARNSNKHDKCRAGLLPWQIKTEAEATSRVDDSILWCEGFVFYRVQEVLPGKMFRCRRMMCEAIEDTITIDSKEITFEWGQFGVVRWLEMLSDEESIIPPSRIKGKAVIVSQQNGSKWVVAIPSRIIKGEN